MENHQLLLIIRHLFSEFCQMRLVCCAIVALNERRRREALIFYLFDRKLSGKPF
ncbi:hypothetical protein D1AOALGA4SA_10399 [Olavius algarvensis Delta 1 endosymbiont]|nr:hypothetical protein D1AOALGA4SA_10399 [Olavius algarvensis Delta 1 endosymbiont]